LRKRLSLAFFDRCLLIRFPHTFRGADADRDLLHKLTRPDQLGGWLNWMLAGLARLSERGSFKVGLSMEQVREQYLIRADPVGEFLRTRLEHDSAHAIPKDQLYEALRQYCWRHGAGLPSKRELDSTMKDEGINWQRLRLDDTRPRCWVYRKLVGEYEGVWQLVKDEAGNWARVEPQGDEGHRGGIRF